MQVSIACPATEDRTRVLPKLWRTSRACAAEVASSTRGSPPRLHKQVAGMCGRGAGLVAGAFGARASASTNLLRSGMQGAGVSAVVLGLITQRFSRAPEKTTCGLRQACAQGLRKACAQEAAGYAFRTCTVRVGGQKGSEGGQKDQRPNTWPDLWCDSLISNSINTYCLTFFGPAPGESQTFMHSQSELGQPLCVYAVTSCLEPSVHQSAPPLDG